MSAILGIFNNFYGLVIVSILSFIFVLISFLSIVGQLHCNFLLSRIKKKKKKNKREKKKKKNLFLKKKNKKKNF